LDAIPRLLWDSSEVVRKSAARMVVQTAFSDVESNSSVKSSDIQNLKSLLRLYLECSPDSTSDVCMEYFVDSLWDFVDCLSSWNSFQDLLIYDQSQISDNEQLSEPTQSALVSMFLCSAKTANLRLENAKAERSKAGKTRLKKSEKIYRDLSVKLIEILPQLLATFQADGINLAKVCQLVDILDLEEYSSLQKHEVAFISDKFLNSFRISSN
jgi:hypothetical protein